MKRLFWLLAMVLVYVSCTDDDSNEGPTGDGSNKPQPTITLTQTALNFGIESGVQTVTFTASDAWTAQVINTRADGWCSISPTSGAAGNVTLTVVTQPNDTPDDRSASIVIKSGTTSKTINVSQKQKDALTVTASKFEVKAEGGEVRIEVKANINFEYSIEESAKSWIKYETTRALKTSTLVFNVSENDDVKKREAKITIKSGKFNEVVTIYQEGVEPAIVISQNEYVVSSDGAAIAVEVKSNVDVSIEMPQNIDWVTENTTRAMSTNTYYFDVAPNEEYDQRTAEIKFINKEDNLSEVVKIIQVQKDALVIAKDSYTVDSEGGQIQIEVGHNVDFDVEIADNWISQSTTRAFVTETLSFNIDANPTNDNREGTIIFKSKDGALSQIVKVYQAQEEALIISKKDIVVNSDSGTLSFEIQTNVDFTVSDPNVSWLRAVQTRGLTSYTLHYEYDANTSYDSREAKIVVTDTKNNKSETITITQAQKDAIVLAKTEYEFGKEGGELDFEIHTNVDVTVNISSGARSWIEHISTRALESKTLHFNIAACADDEEREGTITISGGNATQTITVKQSGTNEALEKEREILIELYNAMGGNRWDNNTRWCSDRPVAEWNGVNCDANGYVTDLFLSYNNLTGSIPESIGNLGSLKTLLLDGNQLTGPIPASIGNLSSLNNLSLGSNQLTGSIPASIGNLRSLEQLNLSGNQLTGTIPASIWDLTALKYLSIGWNKQLTGTITESIGNLSSLENLTLSNTSITGPLPESIGNLSSLKYLYISDCKLADTAIPESICKLTSLIELHLSFNQLTGSIPGNIGNLISLERLHLGANLLTGSIPESIGNLGSLVFLNLGGNDLSGRIPSSLLNHPVWKDCWHDILPQYGVGFSLEGVEIYAPEFSVETTTGTWISNDIFRSNKYTIFYNFFDWNSAAIGFTPKLVSLYHKYNSLGVEVLNTTLDDRSAIDNYIETFSIPWPCTVQLEYGDDNPLSPYIEKTPMINVFDNDGKLVFSDYFGDDYEDISDFIIEKLGKVESDEYESIDYSQDGKVKILQTATKGKGIDIVLMGDAYSDRLIADGTYDCTMNTAMEKFFSVEPYKSFRDHFNVYAITAVSKNEKYDIGLETAFSGEFGDGTHVGGNHSKVIEYGLKAIDYERMNEAMLVVMMNSTSYAGTCYLYSPSVEKDYGPGLSISYFPIGIDDTALEQVLNHETNGHGFAKLADEYAYMSMGTVPSNVVSSTQNMQTKYGWWKNIDFTSDTSTILWAKFIADERYANENLGAYEGADTYWNGVWRPTENSIMRYNTGGFNAPSREAIYYRIHKLAYGDSWEYDYEEFVEWDAINRTAAAVAKRKAAKPAIYQPTHAPIVVNKSWRDSGAALPQ